MNIGHMNDRIMERKIRDWNNNNNNNNRRRKKKNSSSRSCIPVPSGNSLEDQPIKAVQEQQLMNLKIKKRLHSDSRTTTYSMEADDDQQLVHHHQEDVRHRRHPKKMFVESTISSSTASRTTEANQFESDLLKIIRMLSCTRIHDSS
jgi:hypothetical protein